MSKRPRKRVKGSEQRACAGEQSSRPARCGPSTRAAPGSAAKVEEMCRRASRRQSLHAPGDPCDHSRLSLGATAFAAVLSRPDLPNLPEKLRRQFLRPGVSEPPPEAPEENFPASGGKRRKENNAPDTPGGRIRRARESRGLSVRELARLSGVDAAALWRVESLEHFPTARVICRVARALGARSDWLACLGGEAPGVRRVRA